MSSVCPKSDSPSKWPQIRSNQLVKKQDVGGPCHSQKKNTKKRKTFIMIPTLTDDSKKDTYEENLSAFIRKKVEENLGNKLLLQGKKILQLPQNLQYGLNQKGSFSNFRPKKLYALPPHSNNHTGQSDCSESPLTFFLWRIQWEKQHIKIQSKRKIRKA